MRRTESNPEVIKRAYYDGLNNLAVIKRQAAISQMFAQDPVIISEPSHVAPH
jgi:hypothetical protein